MKRERILLVRLSALGDVVQCLPALAALRRARPEAEIGWLVEDRNAGALDGHPQIDRLFRFERRSGGLSAAWKVRREVRAWAPHVAVDLQGNLKGGALTFLSGARRRIGLPRGDTRESSYLFANELVPPGPPGEHRADRALRLVAPLGAKGPAAPVLPTIRPEARETIAKQLAEIGAAPGRYALLLPGTSDYGAFKRWPARRFADLAERLLAERGLASLVGFGPGQRPLAEAVVAAAPGAARLAPDAFDMHEFFALIEGAALVVGSDSGPAGLASVMDVPTVVLFGPKDPTIYAPRGARTAVVWKHVYCSPCLLRRCGDPICMTTMEASEAWTGVERLGALA